jgi:DUF1365 family protein
MTAPGVAAPPDATLYRGDVMHMRLRPFGHRFAYRVFTLLLDADRLDAVAARLRLFSVDRFNVFAFHRRDHGPRDGSDLRPWVEARLAEAGLPDRPARILLLSIPRLFGHAFNPLSVFWCYDADGRLESVVYEVKNTFGDQHPYALPATADADGAIRHDQAKEFFVSPFIGMDQTYRFTLRPPGARLSLRIKQGDAGGDLLIATQNGDAAPLTDGALARIALGAPWATAKVMAAIHWQALRLWAKGARFLGHPGDDRVVRRRPAAPADPDPVPART